MHRAADWLLETEGGASLGKRPPLTKEQPRGNNTSTHRDCSRAAVTGEGLYHVSYNSTRTIAHIIIYSSLLIETERLIVVWFRTGISDVM